MKKILAFLFIVSAICSDLAAQKLDRKKFFEEESIVNATLEMDLKDLLAKKAKQRYLPGTMTQKIKEVPAINENNTETEKRKLIMEKCFMQGHTENLKK